MKTFFILFFFAHLLALSLSSPDILGNNLTTTTIASTEIQSNSTPPSNYFDLSQPLLPALVNSYFLRPLASLNAQINQTAGGIPNQFAQNGQCK